MDSQAHKQAMQRMKRPAAATEEPKRSFKRPASAANRQQGSEDINNSDDDVLITDCHINEVPQGLRDFLVASEFTHEYHPIDLYLRHFSEYGKEMWQVKHRPSAKTLVTLSKSQFFWLFTKVARALFQLACEGVGKQGLDRAKAFLLQ